MARLPRTIKKETDPAAGRPNWHREETTPDVDFVDVSVVMPCLNEEASVAACVAKAQRWLDQSGRTGEVVVVDNGSRDDSVKNALAAGARVVFESRRGYGSALRKGIASARGRYMIMGDCDDTYDFGDLDAFVAKLEDGADMVVGNRYAGGIEPGAMTWSHRYIGTPVITFLLRLFSSTHLGDSQCGLRGFSRVAYDRMECRSDGMEFASEMILKAERLGLSVAESPIRYYPRVGEAKLETFRDGWRHLRFLLLATPNTLYTLPGLMLALIGGLVLGLGISSPAGTVGLGSLEWRPLYAGSILLILGLNALFFAGVAHLYTEATGITPKSGVVTRISKRVFQFERVLLGAVVLLTAGLGLELFLAVADLPAGGVPSRNGLAAVANALILSAGNFGFAGVLASLIRSHAVVRQTSAI